LSIVKSASGEKGNKWVATSAPTYIFFTDNIWQPNLLVSDIFKKKDTRNAYKSTR
jgi:hypothetical protein